MSVSKSIFLPVGAVALLGLAAVVAFEPQETLEPEVYGAESHRRSDPNHPTPPGVAAPRVAAAVDRPRAAKPLVDPASGMGMISGRIAVSTRVIGKISSYTIVVQEDLNTNGHKEGDPQPFFRKQTYPADFSNGTPYFDLENIPFSRHPYRVSVVAQGVNGSSATTFVTAESPLGSSGDVQLSLTPGSYFSILLRDQRQTRRPGLNVRMAPVGPSLVRRDTLFGKSDNNGYVLFENVVKGDYEIRVGPPEAPLAPPKKVQVYASFASFTQGQPTTQGTVILVPDGHHVTVEVLSRWGYGVENARLKAWQLEVQRYYEFTGTTDRAGRFTFENVPYGVYQLSVQSPHNGLKDLKFKVEKAADAPIVKVTMPR